MIIISCIIGTLSSTIILACDADWTQMFSSSDNKMATCNEQTYNTDDSYSESDCKQLACDYSSDTINRDGTNCYVRHCGGTFTYTSTAAAMGYDVFTMGKYYNIFTSLLFEITKQFISLFTLWTRLSNISKIWYTGISNFILVIFMAHSGKH